ncbi:adenosine kinase [Entomobacter blattae]|uniref:adenosine kinase n=1 Tax=Entomobacter blattae TaxID=2762277 RepID=UPI001EEFD7EC|nr:adenosine kinase [Entomobacter blattae]
MESINHTANFDLVGIGNAIVDVQAPIEASFLEEHGMVPGSMTLIDAATAKSLYAKIHPIEQTGGGSVANSCVAAARLGVKAAFLGKVANDELGKKYAEDMRLSGVYCPPTLLDSQNSTESTAVCLIVITADGQRTMNTYLGICTKFGEPDLDEALIAQSRILYLEGYLFDTEPAKKAFYKAAEIAHKAGRKVALSLSDSFCVERHRQDFRALVSGHIDLLFANENEICSLYETSNFEDAANAVNQETDFAVLTRSEKGSLILCKGERTAIEPLPVKVVDTTGAGDAYAAGFLSGFLKGRPLKECGFLGSRAASEVISHFGPRLSSSFSEMA